MSMKRRVGIAAVLGMVAGVAYLATMGCCQVMGWGKKPVSLTAHLALSGSQRQEIAQLEQVFLARKQASCETLCIKRAQMIQILQQESPDRVVLARLTEEISTEQAALEWTTVDHLLAVRDRLDPAQRKKLAQGVIEQLRTACRATACGSAGKCALLEPESKR